LPFVVLFIAFPAIKVIGGNAFGCNASSEVRLRLLGMLSATFAGLLLELLLFINMFGVRPLYTGVIGLAVDGFLGSRLPNWELGNLEISYLFFILLVFLAVLIEIKSQLREYFLFAFGASVAAMFVQRNYLLCYTIWPLFYTAVIVKLVHLESSDRPKVLGLTLLSLAHFLHTYPVNAVQVPAATSLGYVLMVWFFKPGQLFQQGQLAQRNCVRGAAILAVCVVFWWKGETMLTSAMRDTKETSISALAGIRLPVLDADALNAAVGFIVNNSEPASYILPLASLNSAVIWTERDLPYNATMTSWLTQPLAVQHSVMEKLPETKFVIVNKRMELQNEYPPWNCCAAEKRPLEQAIKQDYEKLKPAQWGAPANAVQVVDLYVRK
jgi:hypothetical protein